MADFIIALIVLVIILVASRYIIKAKKNGVKCIGCDAGKQCACGKDTNHSGCSCGCQLNE